MEVAFQNIIEHFQIEGRVAKVIPHGNGLINKTFRLFNHHSTAPDYLMQRINAKVFHDVSGIAKNLRSITRHLRTKKVEQDGILTPISTLSGDLFYRSKEGHYYRMFVFLKDLDCFDKAPNSQYVYEGALAFGRFLKDMHDFPAEKLTVTIPHFHHLGNRFQQLLVAKKEASKDRLSKTLPLFAKAEKQYENLQDLITAIEQNKIPVRATHNDTKFNNVLFRKSGEAACVIDLDTTMPGFVHYDFGDGLRTGAVDFNEDEKDLEKINLQNEHLETYCQGYLNPLKDILCPLEIRLLPLAAPYMALIMSVRFLTDYLMNDTYYHIDYQEQNFMRARCQMRLSELFYKRKEVIERLVL